MLRCGVRAHTENEDGKAGGARPERTPNATPSALGSGSQAEDSWLCSAHPGPSEGKRVTWELANNTESQLQPMGIPVQWAWGAAQKSTSNKLQPCLRTGQAGKPERVKSSCRRALSS